ncbi:MAG: manganese efflux pump family protein [Bacteroidota bacterium]|nr:manganese efflux pump family protein [Bacteroidota bacterium]
MPIIGWIAGSTIVGLVSRIDHWVAFVILSFIGAKMIIDAMKSDSDSLGKDISKGWQLVSLSIATSIDALAVGFSFGLIGSQIIVPGIIIGITAGSMSLIGIKLGEIMSMKFGHRISVLGGIILILIGVQIVLEHLGIIRW